MSNHIGALLERAFCPRILLVGDVMLDRYVWGDVDRVSPEAPIPVLRVNKREHRLGGAGSVASMLAALDASVALVSVTGDDPEGSVVRESLAKLDVDCRFVLTDPRRITTVKERLLGRSQRRDPHHMIRVDQEDSDAISDALREQLLAGVESSLAGVDLVVVSDYNKGVCAGEMIPRLVQLASAAGVRVIADPIKGADYRRYAGCACITPNRMEAGLATGCKIVSPQDGLDAARRLLEFGVETVLVTLDRDGIAWADRHGNAQVFPCRPRQVCDITGAGDMVLSTLGYCLAAGADYPTAVEIANTAGGLEVERMGVVPLQRREIVAELTRGPNAAGRKVFSVDELIVQLERERLSGRRVAMTNGCFDLLHPGHIASLQEARRHGDCLVAAVNSDRTVRELKGPGRPLIDQHSRAEMLAALACVDYVVIFDTLSVAPLVGALRPDVLVKAAQYSIEQVVGHEIVEGYGGQVLTVPMKADYSTTGLINKIKSIQESKRHAA
jgi:D-beta-D-heptose 7-phosphate kinase / D-beta-D-heptose 1-phosphate adenosyltransferase